MWWLLVLHLVSILCQLQEHRWWLILHKNSQTNTCLQKASFFGSLGSRKVVFVPSHQCFFGVAAPVTSSTKKIRFIVCLSGDFASIDALVWSGCPSRQSMVKLACQRKKLKTTGILRPGSFPSY